jgi:hypothetical protein
MMKDQRSANSSDARAIGQYCPYVLTPTASHPAATPH